MKNRETVLRKRATEVVEQLVPCIRGMVGIIENGESINKFAYKLSIYPVGKPELSQDTVFGPFDSYKEANDSMKDKCKKFTMLFDQMITGKSDGTYVDITDGNKVKNWNEQLKNVLAKGLN